MTPDRWKLVVDLFHRVAELPAEDRVGFLIAQCGEDAALREEVASMLAFETTASDPIAAVISTAAETASANTSVRMIGSYRVESILGHGGMGTVYSAVSGDEFRRRVAVKVLKSGFHSKAQLARFEHERKILARLEHPSIARLLDSGTSAEGQPFLVMEYVEGLPVTRYCSSNHLTLDQRLGLFQRICAAVQYAHQNLVIHRDIKPSNILVTPDGHVKLLDFGIGKLLEDGDSERATTLRMMTPDYASPEQVRGTAISTTTDVYSLGVLLYEMLSGSRPLNVKGVNPAEMERLVCEVDPPPPSSISGPRARLLRGDLDNIVMMALRKEPERRYGSVEQMSGDIGLFQTGFPIRATDGTLGYRLNKLARRHAFALVALLAVLASLTGSIAMGVAQTTRANRRFNQVQKLAHTFLFEFHDKIQPLPGSASAREEMVRVALEYLNSLEGDRSADPELAWDIADAYERIGDVQASPFGPNLGRTSEALTNYDRAIRIKSQLAGGSSDPGRRRSLAQAFIKLGEVQMQSGNREAAVASFQMGLNEAKRVGVKTPEDLRLHGYGLSRLGIAWATAGEVHKAADAYRDAAVSLDSLVSVRPSAENMDLLLGTYTRLAYAQISDGDLDQALASLNIVITSNEKSVVNSPLQSSFQQSLFQAHVAAGDLLGSPAHINFGDMAAAEPHYRRAMELAEKMVSLDPKSVQAKANLATAISRVSLSHLATEPIRALSDFKKALVLNTELTESDPANAELQRDRGFLWFRYGTLLQKAGQIAASVQAFRNAHGIQEKLVNTDATRTQFRQDLVSTRLALADVLAAAGKKEDARSLASSALVDAQQLLRDSPHNLYRVRNLSDCYELLAKLAAPQDTARSRELLLQSGQLWEQWQANHKPGPFDTARLKQAQRALAAF